MSVPSGWELSWCSLIRFTCKCKSSVESIQLGGIPAGTVFRLLSSSTACRVWKRICGYKCNHQSQRKPCPDDVCRLSARYRSYSDSLKDSCSFARDRWAHRGKSAARTATVTSVRAVICVSGGMEHVLHASVLCMTCTVVDLGGCLSVLSSEGSWRFFWAAWCGQTCLMCAMDGRDREMQLFCDERKQRRSQFTPNCQPVEGVLDGIPLTSNSICLRIISSR